MKSSTAQKLTKSEIKRLILTEVPRFIKKDREIREFILKISSEKFADKKKTEDRIERILEELKRDRDENQKRWEENQKHLERLEREWNERWGENQKRWEENQKHLERLEREWNERWEENQKKWEENQRIINSILEEIKLLHRKYDTGIGALGSRWGLRAESSFRNAIKDIIEELIPFKVERYRAMDEEGIVFGRPDQIELDLIIKDGVLIVAEIKSSISKGDVATFLRKVQVYERKEGRAVEKKLIISPMVDTSAMEYAIANSIKVYGYPEEIDIAELQK